VSGTRRTGAWSGWTNSAAGCCGGWLVATQEQERSQLAVGLRYDVEAKPRTASSDIDPAPRGPGPTDQIEFLDRLRATIAAHAGAQRVAVWLENADDGLRMRVTDDGVGFLPWIADTGPGPSQLGLVSMREQAAIAGGTCQVVSAPGMGTTVELWLPLSSIG
jgi:hypothetical protein